MKTKIINTLILLIALSVVSTVYAQNGIPLTKNVEKEYDINQKSYFSIKNKFGKIDIKNWDKNKISIKAVIKIDARNRSKAEETMNKIRVDIDKKDTLITAVTTIIDEIVNTDFEINYTIMMPPYLRIDLENKFGNVYIQELTGKSKISVKYGNLRADKLIFGKTKPRTKIQLAYSNADISECDWLIIDIAYGNLDIEKAEALVLKSKYSNIDIEKVRTIAANSKYDTPYEIGEIDNFVCTAKYSDIDIGKLYNLLDLSLKYGNMDIDRVEANFKSVDIKAKYSDIDISMSPSSAYIFDLYSEYGSVEFPKKAVTDVFNDHVESNVKGYVKNKNAKSYIKAEIKYGNVDID